MKNIHIIPTDKPSRLYKSKITQDVFISDNMSQHGDATYNVNIYITSDEEIKEGDWIIQSNFEKTNTQIIQCITEFKVKLANNKRGSFTKKKIILTTDQDLIKDGVQEIDNEFLEWFVKNPSCEEVEIRKEMYMPQSNGKISDGKITHEISLDPSQNTLPYYKIIIPKQEQCTCKEHDPYCCQIHGSCPTCVKKEEQKQHIIDIMRGDEELGLYEEPKQTDEKGSSITFWGGLEESKYIMGIDPYDKQEIVKDLAYWKANAEEDYMKVPISVLRYISELEKQKYSEEDMINFAFDTYCYISELMGVEFNKISENKLHAMYNFEQFKKK